MVDPITDMLNRIKNASAVQHEKVSIPYSSLKFELGRVLSGRGFVRGVEKYGRAAKKMIEIVLQYEDGAPKIRGAKRISKPGQRIYASYDNFPRSQYGGIMVVSTSGGIMTTAEARKKKLGGEVLCEIW